MYHNFWEVCTMEEALSIKDTACEVQRSSSTLSPRSMNFTATISPVCLSRISLATPKLPLPMSRICTAHESAGQRLVSEQCRQLSRHCVREED